MKYKLLFLFILINKISYGQSKKPDHSKYHFVDTIFVNSQSYIAVGFEEKYGESILVYKRNDHLEDYPLVLTCAYCQGRGASGTTYGGYRKVKGSIVFIQHYFNGIDSVYINFNTKIPEYQKVVRHSYSDPREKNVSVDEIGNYIFIPKGHVPISLINGPLGREDSIVKKHFLIRKIKAVSLMK